MIINERKLRVAIHGLAVVTALTWGSVALAQQNIEDRRPVSANVTLEIEDIVVGSVRVVGTTSNELVVIGTIGRDVDEFVIEGGPDYVEIYADWDDWDDHDDEGDRRRWRGGDHDDVEIHLEIQIPNGASLDITGVTANIGVDGVNGEIDIESVTGNIEYTGSSASLDLTNVTGNITVWGTQIANADFENVQGNITFQGSIAPGAELDFETVGGSVNLILPANISANFDIETAMGDIVNEFGPEPRRTNRWIPSKELSFSTGTGGAEIWVETLQGQIQIRRQ